MVRFTKMQGLGNDYLYINLFEENIENPSVICPAICDRHFGVGADGIVLIGKSDTADFSMRIFNADGSESEMCGNATRCIAKYVYERGLTNQRRITLETGGGIKVLSLQVENDQVVSVRVDMGQPTIEPAQIPMAVQEGQTLGYPLNAGGKTYDVHGVSMGNPHCVLFVEDPNKVDLPNIGKLIENHPIFPRRTNVEFVKVQDRGHITMRVWERGSGETLACGTGACASVAAAVLTGRTDRIVDVQLLGGTLKVEWSEEDGHIYQDGPAAFVCDGIWLGA